MIVSDPFGGGSIDDGEDEDSGGDSSSTSSFYDDSGSGYSDPFHNDDGSADPFAGSYVPDEIDEPVDTSDESVGTVVNQGSEDALDEALGDDTVDDMRQDSPDFGSGGSVSGDDADDMGFNTEDGSFDDPAGDDGGVTYGEVNNDADNDPYTEDTTVEDVQQTADNWQNRWTPEEFVSMVEGAMPDPAEEASQMVDRMTSMMVKLVIGLVIVALLFSGGSDE